MKKRWLCALLALWMLAGLLPFAAFAEGEDLTPYVPVLQDAMKNSVSPDVFGEAMFFDLDDKAPREMILVRCPEDAVHAVVEVYTIHGSEAERLMQTPLFVMVGGNTGAVGVGEFENRPILVCESTAPEAGENTVTIHGGVKRFTMDHGRVEIDELEPENTADNEITGGYLFSVMLEEFAPLEPGGNVIQTNAGVTFLADTPSFDPEDGEVCEEQKEYLRNYLQETEDAILSDASNIGDYIDLQSAADYWWIQEFCRNEDGFLTTSSYLYKERDGVIKFGPLWDFDGAYDYAFYDPRPVDGFNNTSMLWLDHLRQENPEFQALLKERYKVFDAALEELVKDGGVIDRYAGENRDAWEKDHAKWGYIERDAVEEHEEEPEWMSMTYDEVVGVYKKWVSDRRDWILANMDDISKVYCDVTFETEDGDVYDVLSGEPLGKYIENAPLTGPEKEGYVFTGWVSKDDGVSVYEKEIAEGLTFVPEYVSEDETEAAEEIRFGLRSISLPAGMVGYILPYVTLPYEAQDTRMTWKSKDSSVAEVDERGRISALKPGDTVITAELLSGASDTIKVHVYDPEEQDNNPEVKLVVDESMTLKAGESCYLDVDFDAGNSLPRNFRFVFNSKDEDVVTVDSNGLVTAVAPGEATIVIRPTRGGINYDRVSVEVKVK